MVINFIFETDVEIKMLDTMNFIRYYKRAICVRKATWGRTLIITIWSISYFKC